MADVQMFNDLIPCRAFQTDCIDCVGNGCFFGVSVQNFSLCSESLHTMGGDIVHIVPPSAYYFCPSIETTTPEVASFNDFNSSKTISHSYDLGIILGILAFLAIILVCLVWLCIIFKRRVTNSMPFV